MIIFVVSAEMPFFFSNMLKKQPDAMHCHLRYMSTVRRAQISSSVERKDNPQKMLSIHDEGGLQLPEEWIIQNGFEFSPKWLLVFHFLNFDETCNSLKIFHSVQLNYHLAAS